MIEIIEKEKGYLHLVCSSKFEHLDRVVDETEAFIGKQISDEEFSYKVVLLVSEAVTNAIEHGNALDESKKVTLDLKVDNKRVQITVEDEGEGFDPATIQNPVKEENLFMDRGRGIFFIQEMADDVTYELNGRRIHIFFNR